MSAHATEMASADARDRIDSEGDAQHTVQDLVIADDAIGRIDLEGDSTEAL